jgi:hypothetical protein
MKRALVWVLLLGAALAGPCAERPYTLETEEGLLGGEEMSYDGEALVFEDRACLEGKGFRLEAPRIVYLEGEGSFQAEGLTGLAQGWRLEAGRLEGKLLKEVRLARGRLRAEAAELTLSSPPEGRKVRLTTPAYRVRADKATFTEKEARLFGFLATPCPCGEDLRLSLEEATFLVDTGELRGEASLGLFGLEVPLSEARVNLNRPPRLESPLVFSASDTGGYTLGLRDFPLPRPGEEVGAWKRRLRGCRKRPPQAVTRPWPAASPTIVACPGRPRPRLPEGSPHSPWQDAGSAPARQRSSPPPTFWVKA